MKEALAGGAAGHREAVPDLHIYCDILGLVRPDGPAGLAGGA